MVAGAALGVIATEAGAGLTQIVVVTMVVSVTSWVVVVQTTSLLANGTAAVMVARRAMMAMVFILADDFDPLSSEWFYL